MGGRVLAADESSIPLPPLPPRRPPLARSIIGRGGGGRAFNRPSRDSGSRRSVRLPQRSVGADSSAQPMDDQTGTIERSVVQGKRRNGIPLQSF